MTAIRTNKKSNTRIRPDVASRIVELSMQHPAFGAKRLLPLLKQENIDVSASSIYNILKRHGLGNRRNRLAKINDRDTLEPHLPKAGDRTEPLKEPGISSTEKPSPEEMARPRPPAGVRRRAGRRILLSSRQPAKTGRPALPALALINLLLLAVLVYAGIHTMQIVRGAVQNPQAVSAVPEPAAPRALSAGFTSRRQLQDYRIIWERGLFHAGSAAGAAAVQIGAVEKLRPARQDFPFVLLGTVVADRPGLSLAVIEDRRLQKQAVYREGDTAGAARIKKILRDQVVIATAGGDQLLSVAIFQSPRHLKPLINERQPSVATASSPKNPATGVPDNNPWLFSLAFEDLAVSLADTSLVLQQARFSDYVKNNEPKGFRIAQIAPNSILYKMGLRNGDVIRGVNGEAVSGKEQAEDVFRTIAQGGVVEIKIKRRRRTRYISLNVE